MAAKRDSSRVRLIMIMVAVIFPTICAAQEVCVIDLNQTTASLNLRRPPLQDGERSERRVAIAEKVDCGASRKGAGRLGTTLISFDRTGYRVDDLPELQWKIENVSTTPIRIPSSPTLADLQPADPSREFVFFSMIIELSIEGTMWSASMGGFALYGDDDHTGTMLTLRPGEWIRIRSKGRANVPVHSVSDEIVYQTSARTTMYKEDYLLTETASATVSTCTSVDQTDGPHLPIQINNKVVGSGPSLKSQ